MNLSTVYSKTAKGVQAITQKGKRLPAKLARALSLVDGRATVEEILAKANELPTSTLVQTLADLAQDGYLKTVYSAPLTEFSNTPDTFGSMVVSETVDETFFRVLAETEARTKLMKEAAANPQEARRKDQAKAASMAEEEANRQKIEARKAAEAEERSRQEAVKRKIAETMAQEEAAFKARKKAEERAQQEAAQQKIANELARIEAEIKADEEFKAQEEAEARARHEAEQQKIAEEQARIEAENKARKQAEEQALREKAEEQALREKAEREAAEAEERIHKEAEERAAKEARIRAAAERKAEEKLKAESRKQLRLEARAREEAERKKAREEAKEKSKEQAEERLRLEAEAEIRARQEAEEKTRAEEAARVKAEIEAEEKKEAERKSREDAEAREKREAEVRAIVEAEEQARREAAEKIRTQEEAQAKTHAEEERKAREEAEQEDRERVEIEARARALADARTEEAEKTQKIQPAKPRKFKHPVKLGKSALIALAALILLPVVLLQVMSLNIFIPPIEKLASDRMHEPVSINSMRASFWPAPHLQLDGVTIGKLRDIKIPKVRIMPELAAIFGETKSIKTIEVESLTLDQDSVARVIAWVGPGNSAEKTQVRRITIKTATIEMEGIPLPALEADIALKKTGKLEQATIRSTDKKIEITITPKDDTFEVNIAANDWRPPFWQDLVFNELHAKAIATAGGMKFSTIEGQLYSGKAKGSATIKWDDAWSAEGDINIENVFLAGAMPALTNDIELNGKLDAKAVYSMHARNLDTLFDAPRIKASFNVRDGAIGNIDLARAIQPQAVETSGGKTLFSSLSGSMTLDGKRYQYRQMKLSAGLLTASGEADILPDKQLSGNASVEMKVRSTTVHARLTLSGDLKQPVLRR